jgi:tetratricopeptide (TPR) repeat protein
MLRFLAPILLFPAMTGCATRAPELPLQGNLGTHHVAISSRNERAQAYFDQGMRLAYAFNHEEAIRAFQEARRIDPSCAICAWGEALAHGPNINLPMDSANAAAALSAIQTAERLAEGASERERQLIAALALRYGNPGSPQPPRDSAYARAMRELATGNPDDLEIVTLYAEAVMNLSPWNYWNADSTPRPGMDEALRELERVVAAAPSHPGACHYYIHAVEAVHPERAIPCAERLAQLMPGAGHLVHMPAHIYVRVGRYADAVESNVHATHADAAYLSIDREPGFYDVGYVPHNHHFLAFAASLAGMRDQSVSAAREAARKTGPEGARLALEAEYVLPSPHLVMHTFGMWDSVLAEPLPPADLSVARGLALYARGGALAATGRLPEARSALDTVRMLEAEQPEGTRRQLLGVAVHVLTGEIAGRERRWDEAETHLRAAVAAEDALPYMEPPYWHHPVRHGLGAVLLESGKARQAESAYREALLKFPENGWALGGLRKSLEAQGKRAEAAEVAVRLEKAWRATTPPAL